MVAANAVPGVNGKVRIPTVVHAIMLEVSLVRKSFVIVVLLPSRCRGFLERTLLPGLEQQKSGSRREDGGKPHGGRLSERTGEV